MSQLSDGDIYAAQALLRRALLDRERVRHAEARDLTARLLVYFHDPAKLWHIAADWLMEVMTAERADGGLFPSGGDVYYPGQFEQRRDEEKIPSIRSVRVPVQNESTSALLASREPLVFIAVPHNRLLGPQLACELARCGTAVKMAAALRTRMGIFGAVCADRIGSDDRTFSGSQFELFSDVVREVLGPILGARAAIDEHIKSDGEKERLASLTPAERRLTELVARGCSYKEIANAIDRSVHTVDHQLHSIRRKLGVGSHARLVQYLTLPSRLDVEELLEKHLDI
ncbi:MAG: helix-turn-helix transcriptional regulator [Rhizobiaceae bacterium]